MNMGVEKKRAAEAPFCPFSGTIWRNKPQKQATANYGLRKQGWAGKIAYLVWLGSAEQKNFIINHVIIPEANPPQTDKKA